MSPWASSLLSVGVVSAIPLLGLVLASRSERRIEAAVPYLVSFAVGAMLGGAVFHLLPEAGEQIGMGPRFSAWFLLGFLGFFFLEKSLWLHDHEPQSASRTRRHPVVTLNLLGDGVHNLVDGMLIAASYTVDPAVGVATTLAVLFHEVPQELGDFGVLVYGGLPVRKAVLYNFASALTAAVGAVLTLLLGGYITGLSTSLLPFAAGSFLYIAGSDLIPELQRERRLSTSLWQSLLVLLGVVLMALLSLLEA
jgi:zinc and cadmium transporter